MTDFNSPAPSSPRRRQQHGLSLVELMVAMTLSLILMAGVVQIMSGSKQSYILEEGLSRAQENARYALDVLTWDLSTAGHLGCVESDYVEVKGTGPSAAKRYNLTNTLSNQSSGTRWDFFTAVYGGDNATSYDSSAIAGTDFLSIRRSAGNGGIRVVLRMQTPNDPLIIDGTDIRAQDIAQYDVMAVADCSGMSVFMVTNSPSYNGTANVTLEHSTGVTAPSSHPLNPGQSNATTDLQSVYGGTTGSETRVFSVFTNTYFIAPTLDPNSSGNSLFVNSRAAGNELVQHVVDFQVTYGIDTDSVRGVDRHVTATDIANTAGLDWNNVMSVHINLTLAIPDTPNAANKQFSRSVRIRNRGVRPS